MPNQTKFQKVVLVSVPYTDTTAPIMAPAALKSICERAGADTVAFDLNAEIHNMIKNHPNRSDLIQFFYFGEVKSEAVSHIQDIFDYMTQRLIQHSPDMVCLSLLHYQCQVCAKWLSFCLKRINPEICITIGGTGITSELVTDKDDYASSLRDQALIDHYIRGDGEESLYQLLIGNTGYAGINSAEWIQLDDLDTIPFPSYDDYDFSLYATPVVGILGSRGCVRQCTFCDVHEHWNRFRWRSAENIFSEMLHQNEKYSVNFFKFQDSLINGNVQQYNRLISLLAEHNQNEPHNRFRWSSYFIFRPAGQMSEEQWRLTAVSGAHLLSVGVESLVDKNRFHIKKKFTNQDVDYALDMAKKYGIKLFFITLVGYPTETEEDHAASLQWIRDHKTYALDPIYQFTVGGTVAILPNTWLDRNQEQLGIVWTHGEARAVSGKNHLWSIAQTNNTYETRLRRMNELIQVGRENGFNMHRAVIDPQKELENIINKEIDRNATESHHI